MNQDQEITSRSATHLFSGTEEEILTHLEGLREEGSLASLGAIMEHLTTTPSLPVKSKILSLIADIKIPGAAAIVANFTFACTNHSIQQELISASWQSRLDFSPYFNRYIELAIAGEMMLVLDVLSLVEECCEKIDSKHTKAAISDIKQHLPSFEDKKQVLMTDLLTLLEAKMDVD